VSGVLPIEGTAAPPRVNGELVFEAPWERDVFGVTLALFEQGVFAWEELQARLIDAIAAREREGAAFHYYECWAQALERLVIERRLVDSGELETATRAHEQRFSHER
jgi:nitrile hydratase accessory protein